MARRIYFDEHIKYLRQIAPGKSSHEITKMFNNEFDMSATRDAVRTLLTKHKIRTGAPKGNPPGYSKLYPKQIKQFIDENYIGNGPKDMADLLNKTFGTNYTHTQLKSYYGRYKLNSGLTGYYKKGNKPWNKGKKGLMGPNKTSFKKGDIPVNHRPVGSERICSKDGYILIKTAEPNHWEHKHRVLWEKEYGPIPDGHAIIFGDGDKRNLSLDNLILVSRKQLLGLNKDDLIQNHAALTKTAVKIVDLKWKMSERKKEIANDNK